MDLNLSMSPQSPAGGWTAPSGRGGHEAFLPHQESLTASMGTKGLINNPGENNCFLNSAIQVLWHITAFRRSLRSFTGHYCDGDACIFCATTTLFKDFRYSGSRSLPPHILRTALAKCFQAQNRFQLGLMDDAAECFEKILEQMHQNLTGTVDPDTCDKKHCVPHQKFAMTVMENTKCRCGATSEPFCYVELLHYVSAEAIVSQSNASKSKLTFGRLLRKAGAVDDERECADFSRCGRMVHLQRTLLNSPAVVSIGLIWDSDASHVDRIRNVVDNIGLKLTLSEMFDSVLADDAKTSVYSLKAVVTYYGKHYSTVCYHSSHKEWVYFDDTIVRTLGSSWSDVKNQFYKGHYQPLLLIYTSDNMSTVDTTQAPQSVVMTADLAVSNTKGMPASEEDLISFDSVKLEGSVQSLKDKSRVLPTPPMSVAPLSTVLPAMRDPEASLLFYQSRPAVTTAATHSTISSRAPVTTAATHSTISSRAPVTTAATHSTISSRAPVPTAATHSADISRAPVTTAATHSADSQDLMSFESIVPQTARTVLSHPTQPRILPVPPPQSYMRTVSPGPSSSDPSGSPVNQPLLLDALGTPDKPRTRQDWVHFTPPSSLAHQPPGWGGAHQRPYVVPVYDSRGTPNQHGATKQSGGNTVGGQPHPFVSKVDFQIYHEIMDYWAKAEAVKDSDKMVALLLYKKTYGLIQSLKYGGLHNLTDQVMTGLDQLQRRCETAMASLKGDLSPSQLRSQCSRCGHLRRLKGGVCKPCELRSMIKQ